MKNKIYIVCLSALLFTQTSCISWLASKNLDCPTGYSGSCWKPAANDASFDIIVPIDASPVCKEIGKLYYKAWANTWQGERKRGTLNENQHIDLMPLSGGLLYPALALVSGISSLYESARKDIKIENVKKIYDEKGCPPMITRGEMQKQLEKKYASVEAAAVESK